MAKVLIVGGVAGGASAAARLRRLDESAQIILFERGEHISYANCGLPYYIGDVIKQEEQLLVQTPEAMRARFNLDVRVNSEVVSIDRTAKKVHVRETHSGLEYDETYDKLILSPGARPFVPRIEGRDLPGVFTLRNVPDTIRIRKFVDSGDVQRAVVVGGGFIGVEMAENLRERGISVTLVEALDQVMAPFDKEMASLLQASLKQNGIQLMLGSSITGIRQTTEGLEVLLNEGDPVPADMVMLSIGVRPESELARDSGLEVGERGGICVDDRQQTSDPDIYAVGDATETIDLMTGKPMLLPLAGPANRQGRTAADNIAGLDVPFEGVVGSSVIKVFDLTAASTGYNEKSLTRAGIAYEKTYIHPLSHAGYYPGGQQMTLKLLFSTETRRVLGAQAIGVDGVDKRIDVIATALKLGATVDQLQNLELCYAPPFSSAKDPVNMAGFTAVNILDGLTHIKHWHDVDELDRSQVVILDVRTPEEFDLGAIDGAINLPVDDLRARYAELPRDKDILIYCRVGLRGYVAERILKQLGFDRVSNLSGGFLLYNAIQESERMTVAESGDAICRTDAPIPSDINCLGYVTVTGDGAEETVTRTAAAPVEAAKPVATKIVDASGLQCPGPILRVSDGIKALTAGDILEIAVTDPAFGKDVVAWCNKTGNDLLWKEKEGHTERYWIRKGYRKAAETIGLGTRNLRTGEETSHEKTMVVFSGELDKALATFIIANGAAAMGRKVTLFFTFWGLNILRKPEKVKVKKDFVSRMFGAMMPRGSKKLALSKLSMGGVGTRMMRAVMKKKNIQSLEELIQAALDNGVKLVACTMSMDVMGIQQEELIDGVEYGGVVSMLSTAEEGDALLFI